MRDTEQTAFGSLVAPAMAERWHDDDNDEKSSSVTVIDSYKYADATYTDKYLYGVNACRKVCYKDEMSVEERASLLKARFDQYKNIHEDENAKWEFLRRSHLIQKQNIKHELIEMVRKNPKVSWESLTAGVDQWCSAATICRRMTTRAGYKLYDERVITLLSKEQKGKHMSFAKHFRNNWCLGSRNYLLVMYDEK